MTVLRFFFNLPQWFQIAGFVAGVLVALGALWFLDVEHPGVRSTAETVMAGMFGANWNKTKAVPKPVQPPRSEDKGGGW